MTRLTILPRNKETVEVFYFDATPLDIILMPFFVKKYFRGRKYFLEKALKEAKSEGKKELYIISWTSLDDAWKILQDDLGGIFTNVPFYVVKNLYRPAYQEMMDWYGIKIKRIY